MNWLADVPARARFRFSYALAARRSRIILSAGMPRSGSTWLFNAVRLMLRERVDLCSGWIGDWPRLSQRPAMLLKVHEYDSFLARRASFIVYSYRDIRDALASCKRKFRTAPTLEMARRWLDADRRWRAVSAFTLRYETMLADPCGAIAELAQALQLHDVDPIDVERKLAGLDSQRLDSVPGSYDPETLLHAGHITDGRHGTWHDCLDANLVGQIEHEFRPWLDEHGFLDRTGRATWAS